MADPVNTHLEVILTEVRGDIKLVLSKVDDTNRRVGEAEKKLERHDTQINAIQAQMWRWVGASSAITALVAAGGTTAALKLLGG